MKKSSVPLWLTAFLLPCFLLVTENRAHGFSGYVDPGSGLLALQCATSACAALAYMMRRRLSALFGRKRDETAPAPESSPSAGTNFRER